MKKILRKNKLNQGQALVTLLFFVIIAITITSAAIAITISNLTTGEKLQEGLLAYDNAESGVENALIRLLRDPDYTGETLSFTNGNLDSQAIVQVNGTLPNKTIVSRGSMGKSLKTIQVDINYSNNIMNILSWKEIY